MLERSILALTDEPVEDFLESVLLSLLIGQVESAATLLVEGRKRVCRVDEVFLERVEMYFTG